MTAIPWSRVNTALLLVVLVAVIGLFASRAYGGPLDPPGAPAPTDSVKLPGTPISSLPFVISQPGNYYVTRNLSMATTGDGITIQASNVTVDLMGFELSAGVSQSAAFSEGGGSPARTGWVIRNGTIRDWLYSAIWGPDVTSSLFEDLTIISSNAAFTEHSIYTGNGNTVRALRMRTNTANGAIRLGEDSRVSECTIEATGSSFPAGVELGANSSLSDCTINGYATGMKLGTHVEVRDCVLKGQLATALRVGAGSTVTGCSVELGGASEVGIESGGSSRIARNTIRCVGTNNVAIVAAGSDWIDENSASDCANMVNAVGTSNTITRNRCRNGALCYNNIAGDDVGTESSAATAANPWSNLLN